MSRGSGPKHRSAASASCLPDRTGVTAGPARTRGRAGPHGIARVWGGCVAHVDTLPIAHDAAGGGSGLHDRQRPAPVSQFTVDRHVGHAGNRVRARSPNGSSQNDVAVQLCALTRRDKPTRRADGPSPRIANGEVRSYGCTDFQPYLAGTSTRSSLIRSAASPPRRGCCDSSMGDSRHRRRGRAARRSDGGHVDVRMPATAAVHRMRHRRSGERRECVI